jgi:hypothetical protein
MVWNNLVPDELRALVEREGIPVGAHVNAGALDA